MKLFIDSATRYLYLAVVDKEKAYSFYRYGKNDHSETLTTFLESFLKEHEIQVEEITEVYVGRGPGSYTGLRIAGTVAKVFAFIKNLPFYSFSSLDLLACKQLDYEGKYKAVIQAKKNYSYLKVYHVGKTLDIVQEDSFVADEKLALYEEYETICVSDTFFEQGELLAKNILKYKLYRKEDQYTYVPNYLRSEFA